MEFRCLVVILLVGSHSARATKWLWVGGTMNASDPLNWQDGLAPNQAGLRPCSTNFRPPGLSSIFTLLSVSAEAFDFAHLRMPVLWCIMSHWEKYLRLGAPMSVQCTGTLKLWICGRLAYDFKLMWKTVPFNHVSVIVPLRFVFFYTYSNKTAWALLCWEDPLLAAGWHHAPLPIHHPGLCQPAHVSFSDSLSQLDCGLVPRRAKCNIILMSAICLIHVTHMVLYLFKTRYFFTI